MSSRMEFALWTTEFIVRFWGIIPGRVGPVFWGGVVVCFVGVGGVGRFWGVDIGSGASGVSGVRGIELRSIAF